MQRPWRDASLPSRHAHREPSPGSHLRRSNLLSAPTRARTLVSQIVRAQYMVVAQQQPRLAQRRTPGTPVLCIVETPPKRARPPGRVRFGRSCFQPRSRSKGGRVLPRPRSDACIQTGASCEASARQPFRRLLTRRSVPGTTRQHMKNGTRRPCRVSARLPPASTQATLLLCEV